MKGNYTIFTERDKERRNRNLPAEEVTRPKDGRIGDGRQSD